MNYYRVTKYNPNFRGNDDEYTKKEWTSVYDIGKSYNGKKFTEDEYLSVEQQYIEAIILSMKESEVEFFKLVKLEKNEFLENCISKSDLREIYESVYEGMNICINEISQITKLILREHVWAKFESDSLDIHFGYDYYMYILAKQRLEKMQSSIQVKDLFFENIKSPYI